jgi:hypothetical protein
MSEAERLSRSIRSFSFSVLRLLAEYREGVVEEQLKLNRIAEGAISLYTTAAVLSKIDSDLQRAAATGTSLGNDVETARFYCNLALDKLGDSLKCLFAHNRDKEAEALSDILTGASIS